MLNESLLRGQDAKLRGTRLLIEGQTFYYNQVTDRVEMLAAKSSIVPRSQTQQVNPQAPGIQNSQIVNFGDITNKNAAWPDKKDKMVTRRKAKRRLKTIISPEDTHKTGNRCVRENSTAESCSETAPADKSNGLNSPQKEEAGDSSENMSDENDD